MPITSGSTPAKAYETSRILTGRPSSRAKSSAAIREAVAPSFRPAALPGGDPAVRAERRLEAGQVLQRGARAHRLVGGGQAPARLAGLRRWCGGPRSAPGPAGSCRWRTPWRPSPGERTAYSSARCLVRCGKRSCRFSAVMPMNRADSSTSFSRDEPRVRVHALAHRVAAHVLDTAGDDDVVRAEGDGAGGGGHGGHRARAHAVDGVAGDGLRQPGEDARGAAEGQALVADLGGRGDGDLVDALRSRDPGCGAAAPGSPSRRGRRRGSRGRCPSGPPCRTGCGRRRRRRRP